MATVINRLRLTGDRDEFERLLGSMTTFMKGRPGFVSHRLYRSARNPDVYVELAEWRDASDHRQAMQSPEFQAHIPRLMKHAEAEPDVFEAVEEGTADH
ncbi:antibiotic biosynthesis monooxygenase family protein [Streptomyces sp. NPDC050560]|uniref:antibiotic biosynthesis monooxygenase family protein n=1 Tax=Streptomyces sp. NPDC050560 TaxID=3365630 RepID=UPI00378EEF3E